MTMRLRSASAVRTIAPPRVFLVEDDQDSRSLIATWLEQGFREVVESATPHFDFGGLLQPHDVFVIDLSLENGDGLELIGRLAQQRFEGAIVLMSAFPEKVIQNVKEIAVQRGLCTPSVLKKPFTHDQLMRSLNTAANAGRSSAPRGPAAPTDRLGDLIEDRRLLFHFQPIVCARSGLLQGLEALARVRGLDNEVRSAAPIIQAADAEELRALSQKAIAEAMHVSRRMAWSGLACRISVNLPSSQLSFGEFEDLIRGHEEGVDLRDALTFEITETEDFAEMNEAKLLVTQKVLQGYRFALDDFGVGASNLDRLAELPFQELKIDRRFVDGCADTRFKRAVCRSAIELARETQAKVIVEGVEREADLSYLRELGVDRVQGYLVAKPMNRAALTAWLANYDAARLIRH